MLCTTETTKDQLVMRRQAAFCLDEHGNNLMREMPSTFEQLYQQIIDDAIRATRDRTNHPTAKHYADPRAESSLEEVMGYYADCRRTITRNKNRYDLSSLRTEHAIAKEFQEIVKLSSDTLETLNQLSNPTAFTSSRQGDFYQTYNPDHGNPDTDDDADAGMGLRS